MQKENFEMNILWRSAEIGNWIIIRKIVVLKARMANIKFSIQAYACLKVIHSINKKRNRSNPIDSHLFDVKGNPTKLRNFFAITFRYTESGISFRKIVFKSQFI